MNLRVWAPRARAVACVVGDQRWEATPLPGGLWETLAPPPGSDCN